MLKRIGRMFSIHRRAMPRFDDEEIGFMPSNLSLNKEDPELFQTRPWRESIQMWMKTLPVPLRPTELATHYPRIAAKIMLNWSDQAVLETYLQTLLFDKRESRQGFPKSVGAELLRLQNFALRRGRKAQLAAGDAPLDLSNKMADVWHHVREKEVRSSKEFQTLL